MPKARKRSMNPAQTRRRGVISYAIGTAHPHRLAYRQSEQLYQVISEACAVSVVCSSDLYTSQEHPAVVAKSGL